MARYNLWLVALQTTSIWVLAQAEEPAAINGRCKPSQIHLSVTGNPTEMRISWKTTHEGCKSKVHYDTVPDYLTSAPNGPDGLLLVQHGSFADSMEFSYGRTDMCAAPARDYKYDSQYFLSSVLTDLTPGQRYYYRVHGDKHVYSFRASPPTGPHESVSFLVYGDMGESVHKSAKSPGAADTAEWVVKEADKGINLICHIGDISYANGRPDVWDTFMEMIEPASRQVPYMVQVGNHEYDYQNKHHEAADPSGAGSPYQPDWGNFGNDSGGECGVPFVKRFLMPSASDPQRRRLQATQPAPADLSNSKLQRKLLHLPEPDSPAADPDDAEDDASQLISPSNYTVAELKQMYREQEMALEADEDNKVVPGDNSPFWYSFDYGPVHFVAISTEHDLRPGSKQHKWLKNHLRGVDRCSTPWLIILAHRPLYVVFPHKSNRVVADHLRAQLEDLFEAHMVDLVVSGHVHDYSRTCNVYDEQCVDESEGGMTHLTIGSAGHKLSYVERDQATWLEHAEMEWGYGRIKVDGSARLLFEFVSTANGEVHDSLELVNGRGNRVCNRAATA